MVNDAIYRHLHRLTPREVQVIRVRNMTTLELFAKAMLISEDELDAIEDGRVVQDPDVDHRIRVAKNRYHDMLLIAECGTPEQYLELMQRDIEAFGEAFGRFLDGNGSKQQ